MALAVVKDLRVAPASVEDLEALETDVLAGFVLARAAAGLPKLVDTPRPGSRAVSK
ncbi:hypothetical protein ACBJ59_04755 [Nonomuraea sp. MTCD27]|uniref:hypothetical protein n=1 Tax=Nonomuraea sp. MTCD27 TaxID=1676747 RepID=UPI0035C1EEAA